ncbi:MAG: FkbM family methyltransferase [Blautia sp.]|nr:FkbM family methyltransferase [Blautia sp.]
MENVIIYGAGYGGLLLSEILQDNQINVLYFMDKSESKIGKTFNAISIVAPRPAQEKERHIPVIVGILQKGALYDSIKVFLKDFGFLEIWHIIDYIQSKKMTNTRNLIFGCEQSCLLNHKNEIARVYNKLGDELSKKVYAGIFAYLSNEKNIEIPVLPYEKQYFAYDIYKKNLQEIFVDCGSAGGNIFPFLLENNKNQFCKYIAIDPAEKYAGLKEEYMKDERVEVVSLALADQAGTLYLRDYLGMNAVIVESETEGKAILADTLDNVIKRAGVIPTFIKIDVEGYEGRLMQGGRRNLEKNPLTAIAIYHRLTDLWEIPLYFIDHFPQNRFYIRSYMNINESVFYSVPKERQM